MNGPEAKFLDFRKPEVIEYLDEKVIKFLKDSGIGYLKVDYNANVGILTVTGAARSGVILKLEREMMTADK